MSRPSAFRAAALGSLMCLLAFRANAGALSPCDDPAIYDATVQVFLFPYEAKSELTAKGRALATLLQRHVLFAALKYRSIGVGELVPGHGPCNYETVTGRIRGRLRSDQTAIFLSGSVFEQDGRIYLKNFVSVATGANNGVMRWPLAADARAITTTTVPLDVAGFAPRTIPISFLEQMESSQQLARRVHKEPSEQAPYDELPSDASARYTFAVLEARDDWMHVRVEPFGLDGWIPAHALATGEELKGEFPELYFVDGLIGYFSITSNAARDRRLLDSTLTSFDRYLNVTAGRTESDARSLAMVLKGNARLRAEGAVWSTPALQSARDDFRRAVAESPGWTPAGSQLLASTAMLCARAACENEARTLETGYLEAIGRDPINRDLIQGLSSYYQAVSLKKLPSDLTPAELTAKRARVQAVQTGIEQQ